MSIKVGDHVYVYVCDDCQYRQQKTTIKPPASGIKSFPCHVCGHYGIGSTVECVISDWPSVKVLSSNYSQGSAQWLKPVARVIPDHAHGEGVTTIAQIVEQELPAGAELHIIPDTHRVVSVELLRKALRCVDGSPYAGETTYQSLRASIDNKGE